MNRKRLISSVMVSCIFASSLLCGCSENASPAVTSGSSAVSSETAGSSQSQETSAETTKEKTPAEIDQEKLKETGRTQYRAELSIERPKTMEEFVYVKGTQSITLRNDSSDVWKDVVLREYSPAILENEVWSESSSLVSRPYKYGDKQHTAIEKVSSDGKDLAFEEQGDKTVVKITLDKEMAPGEIRTIDLSYTVKVAYGSARQAFAQTDYRTMNDPKDSSRIIVALGPILPTVPVYENGKWMADDYFDSGECFYTKCSDYNVTVKVPDGFNLAASGKENKIDDNTFEVSALNMRDFALIAADSFNYIEEQCNGKNIRVWYYDTGNDIYKKAADFALKVSVDSMKTFTEYYGEYAYDDLDVVFAPYLNGGMEYPGMVRITEVFANFLSEADQSGEGDDDVQVLRTDIVHEIAHEWFYSSVGNDQFNEPWLDEGFARFSELVFMEKFGYKKHAAAFCTQMKGEYKGAKKAPVDVAASECSISFEGNDGDKYSYGWTVYSGGALFLYDLRETMGKEKFDSFIHSWYSDHMNSEVTTKMFFTELFKVDDSEAVHKTVNKYFREKSMP